MSSQPGASRVVVKFHRTLDSRMDAQCPATQDAIDRLVASAPFRGRAEMLEALKTTTRERLCEYLLVAWTNDRDLIRATGFSRDYWTGMIEGEALCT